MSHFLEQLDAVVRAIVFHSPISYSWFGVPAPRLSQVARRGASPRFARDFLLYNLQNQLYRDFYCRGGAQPSLDEPLSPFVTGLTPFVESLSAANGGSGCIQSGWHTLAVDEPMVCARRHGLELIAPSTEWTVTSGGPISPGMVMSLRLPKDLLGISPAYFMALGNIELPDDQMVRLYWNLSAEGALQLMRIATRELNASHTPFRLKVLNDPKRYGHSGRCDTAVLYLCKDDYLSLSPTLQALYSEVALASYPMTPALTKRLAPGLALAEDPGRGESFGLHRCRLISEGLLVAYEQERQTVPDRLAALIERLEQEGITSSEPYLIPGSTDIYQPFDAARHTRRFPRMNSVGSKPTPDAEAYMATASALGRRISSQAVWHDGMCNWVGAAPRGDSRSRLTYTALGTDLYSGTAGIALFLAELYAVTRDHSALRTAEGAIRHALFYAQDLDPSLRLGLYTGAVGVAFSAIRVGLILDDSTLIDRAGQLLHDSLMSAPDCTEFDLLSGRAGAIVAALISGQVLNDKRLSEPILSLADELIKAAEATDGAYSWKSPNVRVRRNLTGLSHGTAGIGYALLELYQVTKLARYRNAAEMAFEYERRLFDPEAQNWPDFRVDGAGRGRLGTSRYSTYWCHGAPGIALSRLRAYELLGAPTCKDEAITALDTTLRATASSLQMGTGNFSLCHGLTGNAEILRYGSQLLGDEWSGCTDGLDVALQVAATGIERYAAEESAWPCGAGGGETPSLFLGLAGIGLFYLRLYAPDTPGVLLPTTQLWNH